MAYYNKGVPEVRNECPAPPYNSPLNPNYSTFANQPQFPLNTGSNAQQQQRNTQALTYFIGLNQQTSDIVAQNTAGIKNLPYPTFKSQGERLLYLQGQTIAAAKSIATNTRNCSTIYSYINKTA
jgi:hypothetical protein